MKILIMLSMLLGITFSQTNHPLALGLILLCQTIITSLLSGMIYESFWFSYVLFLIFLGGMLVLFIYVTSIASNEMFYISMNMIILLLLCTTSMIAFMNISLPTENQEILNFNLINNTLYNPIMKLYNQPTNIITIMMASYLFLSLIAVVKIINIFKGPLRKTN